MQQNLNNYGQFPRHGMFGGQTLAADVPVKCSLWCCTLTSASPISSYPLNCSDCSLPTPHTGQMQLWGSQAALPSFSKHLLTDKENHSLTQAVRWYHGLQWNSALLKCLPKNPGLGFHFMWHTQTCPWHHRLQWAFLPSEQAKQGISISSFG